MKTGILTAFLLAALLLAVPACVELNGQRITIRYDAANDVLRLILCYDGIHDSGSDEHGKGAEQLAEFIENGDLMLFNWMGRIQMESLRSTAANERKPPAVRALSGGMAEQIKSTYLGRYRDPDGNMGAAQLVEIRDASDLIRKANAVLNEAILADDIDRDWARTAKRMRAGAEEGRQWIFIEGHSIGIRFPAHLREWSQRKVDGLKDMLQDYNGLEDDEADAFIIQLLASSPFSITETKHNVTIRLGEPTAVSTLRLHFRNVESNELDPVLEKLVPADLDRRIADSLLGTVKAKPGPALRAIIEWGPPEERVRALVARLAKTEDEKAALEIIERLQEWGRTWNRENGYPDAPMLSAAADPIRWNAWYRKMVRFPR